MIEKRKKVVFLAKCVIFCAGEYSGLIEPIAPEDLVIAADGGYRHILREHIAPHIILGDFDSLGYVPENAEVFPTEKDDTDGLIAARKGLDAGCREFIFYGALEGDRVDHTVANFGVLQFLAERGAKGYLIGKSQIVTLIQNSAAMFSAQAAGTVSVFCFGAPARGVTLEGLKYPLQDGTLTAGFPLGVSNAFVGEQANISVKNGSLLVIYDRKNGLPY